MNTTTIIYLTKNGLELEVTMPAKFELCPRCEGRGTHVNPSIDSHGISPEEFAEDPDFEEAYFSGRYDVQCYACKGLRVVPVIDESRLTKRQRFVFERWQKQRDLEARWEAEDRRTRFWENGGRD